MNRTKKLLSSLYTVALGSDEFALISMLDKMHDDSEELSSVLSRIRGVKCKGYDKGHISIEVHGLCDTDLTWSEIEKKIGAYVKEAIDLEDGSFFSNPDRFAKWVAGRNYPGEADYLVPAIWYKDKPLSYRHEIFNNRDKHYTDPYRPVVMRGAKAVLVARWAASNPKCANGYVDQVVKRWIQRNKFTCDNFSDSIDAYDKLIRRACRGLYTTHHAGNPGIFPCTFKDGVPIDRDGHANRWW